MNELLEQLVSLQKMQLNEQKKTNKLLRQIEGTNASIVRFAKADFYCGAWTLPYRPDRSKAYHA